MSDYYKIKKDCVEITIHKPLHGTFVYIRDKYLNVAKQRNIPLKITIPNVDTYENTYENFMDGAKKMEKVVYYPDNPMILYGNYANKNLDEGNKERINKEGVQANELS